MAKLIHKNGQILAFISVFCLIQLIVPQVSEAQTISPIKITELTCDKDILAPDENATVRIYMKNIGHESLQVFGELNPNPNASIKIDVLVGFGNLNGDSDSLYYMEYYVTNTGEYSQDTDVTIKASIFGSHVEGSYSMNATELDAVPELTSESFTVTFLKNDAISLQAQPSEATPSYAWILIILTAVIAVICIALIVYRRRKKAENRK
jgi:hypothetical protein